MTGQEQVQYKLPHVCTCMQLVYRTNIWLWSFFNFGYSFQILNTVDLIERFKKSLHLLKRQKEVWDMVAFIILYSMYSHSVTAAVR